MPIHDHDDFVHDIDVKDINNNFYLTIELRSLQTAVKNHMHHYFLINAISINKVTLSAVIQHDLAQCAFITCRLGLFWKYLKLLTYLLSIPVQFMPYLYGYIPNFLFIIG